MSLAPSICLSLCLSFALPVPIFLSVFVSSTIFRFGFVSISICLFSSQTPSVCLFSPTSPVGLSYHLLPHHLCFRLHFHRSVCIFVSIFVRNRNCERKTLGLHQLSAFVFSFITNERIIAEHVLFLYRIIEYQSSFVRLHMRGKRQLHQKPALRIRL